MKRHRILNAKIIKSNYVNGKIEYSIDFEWIYFLFSLIPIHKKTRDPLIFETLEEAEYYIHHIWRPSKEYSDDYDSGIYVYPLINNEQLQVNYDFKSYPNFKTFVDKYAKDEVVVSKIIL